MRKLDITFKGKISHKGWQSREAAADNPRGYFCGSNMISHLKLKNSQGPNGQLTTKEIPQNIRMFGRLHWNSVR